MTGDALVYRAWSDAVLDQRLRPYAEVAIEYPPGSLPFVLVPRLSGTGEVAYRDGLIAVMLAVDAIGLAGLIRLARRTGGALGPWLWVVTLPALGPLSLLRLDLVPAVATIWAVALAARGGWWATGASLGLAVLVKLYAALLLPLVWLASPRRRALLAGVAVVVGIGLLPFAGDLPALWESVAGYHARRGIQVESTWGAALLGARALGRPVTVDYSFGAFHASAPGAEALARAAVVLSVVALLVCTWLSRRVIGRGDAGALATAMFATLTILLVTGTVLSPQFLLWSAALAATALSFGSVAPRAPLLLVVLAAALTQAIYPFSYGALLAGEGTALGLLAVRNIVLAVAAAGAWRGLLLRASVYPFPRDAGPEARITARERTPAHRRPAMNERRR